MSVDPYAEVPIVKRMREDLARSQRNLGSATVATMATGIADNPNSALAKVLAQTEKHRKVMRTVDNYERVSSRVEALDRIARSASLLGTTDSLGRTAGASKVSNLAKITAGTVSIADAFPMTAGTSKVSNLAKIMAGTDTGTDRLRNLEAGSIAGPTARNRLTIEKLAEIAKGTTAARFDASAAGIVNRNTDLFRAASGATKYGALGTLARANGKDALPPGMRAPIDPESMPGLRALRSMMDAAAGPAVDTTAFRSSFDRAVGATAAQAVRDAAHAFEAPVAAPAPSPLVIVPNVVADPVAEVFAALGIELDASNTGARAAFVQGYLVASRYRYSTVGRWVAWAIAIVGASTGFYGSVTHSDTALGAAIGILVAVFAFPEAKRQD